MSDNQYDPTRFMESFAEQWGEAAKNATSVWRGLHRQWATTYRDYLDRQLADEPAEGTEPEWAEGVTRFVRDSMGSHREARTRFLESQRSMVDRYVEWLDSMSEEHSAD
jgi:hypothetical protein